MKLLCNDGCNVFAQFLVPTRCQTSVPSSADDFHISHLIPIYEQQEVVVIILSWQRKLKAKEGT